MDFSVEFYETVAGRCPVREFLDELKASDPSDFAAVLAGLSKLRDRRYHAEPLSKALGEGLFELRHVGKLNTRVLWFRFGSLRREEGLSLFMPSATRVRLSPPRTFAPRMNEPGSPSGQLAWGGG